MEAETTYLILQLKHRIRDIEESREKKDSKKVMESLKLLNKYTLDYIKYLEGK